MDRREIKRRAKKLKTRTSGFYGLTSADFVKHYGDAALLKPLIVALGRVTQVGARIGVIQSLAKIGDDRAAQPLVSVLQNDENPLMCGIAAAALGELKGEYAFYYLCETLWADTEELNLNYLIKDDIDDDAFKSYEYRNFGYEDNLHRSIISAMLKIDRAGAISLFREALGNAKLRSKVIYALVIARDTQINGTLIQMFDDADKQTQEHILWALKRIGDNSVKEKLTHLMLHGKMDIHCAIALSGIEERERKANNKAGDASTYVSQTGRCLVEMIENSSDIKMRRQATFHLQEFRCPDDVDVLKQLLDDEDSKELWCYAADALATRLSNADVYELMAQLLERDDVSAQYAAVSGLRGNLDPRTGERICELLQKGGVDEKTRGAAVYALGYFVEHASVRDSERSFLMITLGYSRHEDAYMPLVRILKWNDNKHAHKKARTQAAQMLGNFVRADAIETLLEVIDRDWSDIPLNKPADESIGKILSSMLETNGKPEKKAIDMAERVAKNQRISDATCLAAVRLLARANDPAYFDTLMECAARKDPEVRRCAIEAAENMPGISEFLLEALRILK